MNYGYARVSTKEQNEQRQAEGIAAAKSRGVQFGRKPKEKPPELSDGSGSMAQKGVVSKSGSRKARRHA